MPDFDLDQLEKDTARAIYGRKPRLPQAEWNHLLESTRFYWRSEARAALSMSVILPAVTEQVRALHHDVVAYDDFAMTSGRRECSCGRSDCPTVRLLDELDAAVRADS